VSCHGVPEEQAEVLARLSKGCLGWAIGAAQGEDMLAERTERFSNLLKVIEGTVDTRLAHAEELAREFSKNRNYGEEILDSWIDWWRDLLLLKGGMGGSVVNIDYEPVLRRQVDAYSLGQIKDFIQGLLEARTRIRQNVNARLVLETLMLGMPGP
jgi:DNA polymerase III gamma/tau subunit